MLGKFIVVNAAHRSTAVLAELIPEFFGGLVVNAKCCLHLHQICGRNSDHIVEAPFKATARALRQAIAITGNEIPSTKGSLA